MRPSWERRQTSRGSIIPVSEHVSSIYTNDDLIGVCAVNPQAVNQVNLDVFSRNKRSVLFLKHTLSGKQIAFVAIGALLVGSIVWTVEVSRPVEI